MPMYNLVEYSNNSSKTFGSLLQYYKDDPNDDLSNYKLSNFKAKITTPNNNNKKDVEIVIPSKHLSNYWRTLEMSLINCEVNLILNQSTGCVISSRNGKTKFEMTDTKLYVPLIT